MQQVSRMQVVKPKQQLIDNILLMDLLECSFVDGVIDIRVHELEDQVNVSFRHRRHHLEQLDDVGVLYLLEDGDFPEGALRICRMLEGFKHLLQRKGLISPVISCYFPHVTVSARADLLDDLVSIEDVLVDSLVIGHQTDIYYKNKIAKQ